MRKIRITFILTSFWLASSSVFSQSTIEQKVEKARNTIDHESYYLGDSIIIKQSIKQIEKAINNYNIDEIFLITASSRKNINPKVKFKNLEKERFSKSINTLDSLFKIVCRNISESKANFDSTYYLQNRQKHFKVSNINLLRENDSIISVSLNLKFNPSSYFFPYEQNIKMMSNSSTNQLMYSIHDTWVFEKVLGQWKLQSCDHLIAALNNINQK